ncbi:MAG: AraC family transcriptional regulator [Rubrivivax sp.]|nr:AraC family transcriptional regulator [Rubrivivax sp.]
MTDFASATMLRLLSQGMHELGLQVPLRGTARVRETRQAHVHLDDKRALIAAAVQQRGLSCLPLLARGLRVHHEDPTHRALAGARDVPDLLRRWCRLERYIHSRHRVDVLSCDAHEAVLLHRSVRAGQVPQAAEDLVVVGVLAALLQAIVAHGVRASVAGAAVWPTVDSAPLHQAVALGNTARWRLQWQCLIPATDRPARPSSEPDAAPVDWPPLARRAAALVSADLSDPWPLPRLAHRLGLATRSYQRGLADGGLSHSELVAQTRCRVAARWLVRTSPSLAEVGFLCGYADQAHFTRSFTARVGLPPGQYRQSFATA